MYFRLSSTSGSPFLFEIVGYQLLCDLAGSPVLFGGAWTFQAMTKSFLIRS
jgi:hypothetical protein